jgi:hypothetical protein
MVGATGLKSMERRSDLPPAFHKNLRIVSEVISEGHTDSMVIS